MFKEIVIIKWENLYIFSEMIKIERKKQTKSKKKLKRREKKTC